MSREKLETLEDVKDFVRERYNEKVQDHIESVAKAMEDGSFDGASSWFGHADDALAKGEDFGFQDAMHILAHKLGILEEILESE